VAAGRLGPRTLDDVLLLTTELVTNAIRHAGDDPLEVSVSIDEISVRVAVRDTGPGFDPGEAQVRTENGGWGLDLVEGLASRWGVDPGGGGTDVWFEIETAP
jgi:anti-sigma regulatory factor (Ser/Thr protein kinase)